MPTFTTPLKKSVEIVAHCDVLIKNRKNEMDIALDFMIPADSNYLLYLIPEIIKNNIFFSFTVYIIAMLLYAWQAMTARKRFYDLRLIKGKGKSPDSRERIACSDAQSLWSKRAGWCKSTVPADPLRKGRGYFFNLEHNVWKKDEKPPLWKNVSKRKKITNKTTKRIRVITCYLDKNELV